MNYRYSGAAAIALVISALSLTIWRGTATPALTDTALATEPPTTASSALSSTAFLVVAGGGTPAYNEIALEKNVQYFQRTLAHLERELTAATVFFANGNTDEATVRYLDLFGRERFKVPDIPHLAGAANAENVRTWLTAYPQTELGREHCPAFLYFTGHGWLNEENPNDNALILWEEALLSVQTLAQTLDQWPVETPFVTMMAQCYAGAFANLIYEGGDPSQPVSAQSRCGFFATIKTRPSVGCTPLVNEADYRDYSSSYFAGLSGRDRVGNPVASTDYNQDGEVSFAEAHAFAKIDGETSDWPISTSEAWLQRQVSPAERNRALAQSIKDWLAVARPEQQAVMGQLAEKLGYDLEAPFNTLAIPESTFLGTSQEVLEAYHMRLKMTLLAVAAEGIIRDRNAPEEVAILNQLLTCEAGTW